MQKPEHDLDTAIDQAVRELMDVDADAAFRARVTARLHRPSRRWAGWRMAAVAAGAVTALLLAVLLVDRSRPVLEAPTVAEVSSPAAAPAPPGAERSGTQPTLVAEDVKDTPRPGPRRRPTLPAPSLAAQAIAPNTIVATVAPEEPVVEIEPLNPVVPISVAQVAPREIDPGAIVVAPLDQVIEVQVVPLTPRLERD